MPYCSAMALGIVTCSLDVTFAMLLILARILSLLKQGNETHIRLESSGLGHKKNGRGDAQGAESASVRRPDAQGPTQIDQLPRVVAVVIEQDQSGSQCVVIVHLGRRHPRIEIVLGVLDQSRHGFGGL